MKTLRIEPSVPWWRNALINGNAQLWQRGTSSLTLSTSRQYRADRFYAYDMAGTTATIQQSAALLPANNLSDYAMLITGGTGTTDLFVGQCIESFNAHDFVRQRFLAFSCWLYNGTSAAFTPVVQFRAGNANDTFTSGAFSNAVLASGSCGNGVWTQVKGILDLSALSNLNYGLQVEIKFPSGSLDTGSKLVYLTQFMLNPGNEYAPFMMASGWDISEEIRKAKRYCYMLNGADFSGSVPRYTGWFNNDATFRTQASSHPVEMRVAPAITPSATTTINIHKPGSYDGTMSANSATFSAWRVDPRMWQVLISVASAAQLVGEWYLGASGTLLFEAEL